MQLAAGAGRRDRLGPLVLPPPEVRHGRRDRAGRPARQGDRLQAGGGADGLRLPLRVDPSTPRGGRELRPHLPLRDAPHPDTGGAAEQRRLLVQVQDRGPPLGADGRREHDGVELVLHAGRTAHPGRARRTRQRERPGLRRPGDLAQLPQPAQRLDDRPRAAAHGHVHRHARGSTRRTGPYRRR